MHGFHNIELNQAISKTINSSNKLNKNSPLVFGLNLFPFITLLHRLYTLQLRAIMSRAQQLIQSEFLLILTDLGVNHTIIIASKSRCFICRFVRALDRRQTLNYYKLCVPLIMNLLNCVLFKSTLELNLLLITIKSNG